MKKRKITTSLLALSIAAMTAISMGQIAVSAEENGAAVSQAQAAETTSSVTLPGTESVDTVVTPDAAAASAAASGTQKAAAVTAIPQYRMYNVYTGEHFYTQNETERNKLIEAGWNYEGYAWMAAGAGNNAAPVYRLYNRNTGDHHYTTSAGERDALVRVGWRYEQVGWYSDPNQGIPVYRLYNSHAKTGTHHYTIQAGERDSLRKAGWKYEGVAWYAVNKPTPADDHEAVMKRYRKVTILDKVDAKAQAVKSDTPYQIQIDCTTHQLYIYKGSTNNWQRIHKWPCGDGKPSTPSPRGVTKVTEKWLHFGEPNDTCWYATMYRSPVYLMHSVVYYPGSKTRVMDGRVGQGVSHGCVRLKIENAKWIYDNIPIGTTVTVFDE